jgi:hypothetical protein
LNIDEQIEEFSSLNGFSGNIILTFKNMKKILFKTVGWICMVVMIISLLKIDPFINPWKFIFTGISIFGINEMFDLYIQDKLSKIKDWFVK